MLVVILLVRQFPVTNFTEESLLPGFIRWGPRFIVFDGLLGSGDNDDDDLLGSGGVYRKQI